MRDIKFRAFHKETKEMYGIRRIDFSVNEVVVDKLIKEWGHPCVNMEKIELMQYSGLKDKKALRFTRAILSEEWTGYQSEQAVGLKTEK